MGYQQFGEPHSTENLYYQVVAQPQDAKPRRAAYNRSLNAVENWAWFTQRLVEIEEMRARRNQRGQYVESMEFDIDDDNELVLDHDYDEESDMYRPRVLRQRGGKKAQRDYMNIRVLQKWRRITLKLLNGGESGWQDVQRVVNRRPT